MKISAVLCTLVALVAIANGEILEGQFNSNADEYPLVDDTELDPTANSAIFKHDGDMTYVIHNEKSEGRDKRNAVYYTIAQWPGGIIPYYISPSFNANERRVILLAMQEWENKTCIRFVPGDEVLENLFCIDIMQSTPGYCASFVGRLYYYPNRCQGVALGAGCVHHKIVLHELGHAIGFHHEHNRPDRDEYINVNVDPASDIARQVDRLYYVRTLGLGYDYASIMHYGSLGGVITSKVDTPFGNAQELSPLDVIKTNTLYNCPTRDRQPPSRLEPIPPMWSLPHGTQCGKYLKVNKDGSFRFPGSSEHRAGQNCTYVLEAPKGYGFDFTIPDLTRFRNTYWPCRSKYIQFLSSATLSNRQIVRFPYVSNGRICDRSDARDVFRVRNNVVTINYRSDTTPINMEVRYKLQDINECSHYHHCHSCTNLKGAYSCDCNDGYYHSYASNSCYDVNECSFDNGGCDQRCVNRAGGYECACNSGHLQEDGKSCGPERPDNEPADLAPGTIMTPSTAPTTVPPTTGTIMTPSTAPTTVPPTTTIVPKPPLPHRNCSIPDTNIDKRTCFGGVVSGETFTPASFPNFMKKSGELNCRHLILASDKEQIRFKYIDLPPDSTCDELSITVRRTFNSNGVVLRRICGDELKTCGDIVVPLVDRRSLVSITGTLSADARGFVATVEPQSTTATPVSTTLKPTTPVPTTPKPTTPEPTTPVPTTPVPTTPKLTTSSTTPPPPRDCSIPETAINKRTCYGGVKSGVSFSPANFPNFIEKSVEYNCRQLILASNRHQVRFKYIDLPPHSTCDEFSITVRRTFNSNGVVLRRICGEELKTCGDIVVPLMDKYSLVLMTGTLNADARGFVAVIEPQP